MQAQEVYLHCYCIVATRLDKIHIYIPALGHTYWHLLTTTTLSTSNCARGVPIIVWVAEHARGFYYHYRDSNGDFLLCVCVCANSSDSVSANPEAFPPPGFLPRAAPNQG